MSKVAQNPFAVTKAVDLKDEGIADYWVDISTQGGFAAIIKPASPMPMLLLGGKGSGKTHIMRYFSYPLQRMRCGEGELREVAQAERYVGIYVRCRGLNASRFRGKGQSDEVWRETFAYYFELWLAQLVLEMAAKAFPTNDVELARVEGELCARILARFDSIPGESRPESLAELVEWLKSLRREVDSAVNNCALRQELPISIIATRGELIFGIPQILTASLPCLNEIRLVYLIDEFENFSEEQQKYINTLLREKELPCSFKIGSRLYGVRTYSTYSADEENKEGSEYEKVVLDAHLRTPKSQYARFARDMVLRRLVEAGALSPACSVDVEDLLSAGFHTYDRGTYGTAEALELVSRRPEKERPCHRALRDRLHRGSKAGVATGVGRSSDIDAVVAALQFPEHPLVEKAAVFMLYQEWYSNRDLAAASAEIHEECKRYISSPSEKGRCARILSHFRTDFVAQLRKEYKQPQKYLGFDTFVEMSCGLPRNLLIILKHIFSWATFKGELPFGTAPISMNSQRRGVLEASNWFFTDARVAGGPGRAVREAVSRLATLFRDLRYSDKPVDPSLVTFSSDLSAVSDGARNMIEVAEKWSLLLRIPGGQRDRNSARVDAKFQLNSMLSPRWDLPISRRGAIALAPPEVNAIFDPAQFNHFVEVARARVDRTTAPFFGKRQKKAADQDEGGQMSLSGLGDA